MTNNEVIARFIDCNYGQSAALFTEDGTIWSYDYRLAYRHSPAFVLVNRSNHGKLIADKDAAFIATTCKHRAAVIRALDAAGINWTYGE